MLSRALSMLGILAFLSASGLRAETVEVTFGGMVFAGIGDILPGSTFSGKIVYDNTVAETPGSPSGAWFDAISSLELTYTSPLGASFAYTADAGRILVENDSGNPASDNIGFANVPVGTLVGPAIEGLVPAQLFIVMSGGDPGLFPSLNLADLPTSYSLSDFTGNSELQVFVGATAGYVVGALTSLEAQPVGGVVDSDGDGIPDDQDACPNSDLRPTVVIGGCDTGVVNVLFPDGCTIADQIAEILAESSTNGYFISQVALLANNLVETGVLGEESIGALMSCAARVGI